MANVKRKLKPFFDIIIVRNAFLTYFNVPPRKFQIKFQLFSFKKNTLIMLHIGLDALSSCLSWALAHFNCCLTQIWNTAGAHVQ